MIIDIQAFSAENKNLLKNALNIRYNVFTLEQNVDKDIEFDGLDFEATHYLVKVDNIPVATARWRETDEGIKIERMAVLKNYRSYGIGNLLMRFIIKEILPSKQKIYLHAQKPVITFYEQLHFKKEGDFFKEASIEHIKMYYSR